MGAEINSPFILEKNQYKRNLNPFKSYIEQAALYLSVKYEKPIDECLSWIKENVKIKSDDGSNFIKKYDDLSITNPKVTYISKDENGDRKLDETTLTNYLMSAIKNDLLISPTLTIYENPKVKKSHLVDFIDSMIGARSLAKKEKFKYKMAKGDAQVKLDEAIKNNDEEKIKLYKNLVDSCAKEEAIQDNKQANAKIMNNSLSGAGVIASTPIFNPTMHSTLTSTCRSSSSYANANNEKLLRGNRHYHKPDIALNNIISIIKNVDYDKIQNVINKYNLRIPTAEETMEIVLYSSRQYWTDIYSEVKIKELIDKLNDLQRAAFCYVSDIFTLAKFNDKFVRTLIKDFSKKLPPDESLNDNEIISSAQEEVLLLAVQICSTEMRGKQIDSIKGTLTGKQIANTILNINNQLERYRDYIETFLRTSNVPASIAFFPSSIRHSVLMSDTDSTIFTTEYWNNWIFGELKHDDEANGVFATMVFFAVSTLKHILALMSGNFGIGPEKIHQIAMKNEFKFDVFVPTLKTKHYYAIISYQEGNVFNKVDQEIKGVHLKSSNAPKIVIEEAKQIMLYVCKCVKRGEKISIKKILKTIADREREIIRSVKAGEITYYRGGQIKSADTYKNSEEESNYRYYSFWNETFGHKYGMISPPPYSYIKLSTGLKNKTKMNEWLSNMEDKELSSRISDWLRKTNREVMPSYLIPSELFAVKKLPIELVEQVDIRSLVSDVCHSFYFILETLGIFRLNKEQTRLISDEF